MAVIAYIVFFIPLLTKDKNDPFVEFHTKQGMILFVLWCTASLVGILPLIGRLLQSILALVAFVLTLMGIYYAYNGWQKSLPLVGKSWQI